MRNTPIAIVFVSSFLAAQDAMNSAEISREQRMAARDAAIDGRLGFDFQTQYFFRGILQENQGVIFQPSIDLGYDLLDNDDGLQDLRVVFGQWNSLHSGTTGSTGGIWYKSRFYLGVEGQIADRWHFGTRFNTYNSPNGGAPAPTTAPGLVAPIQELAFYGRFDDNGVLIDALEGGLQPTVLVAIELSNQRDAGNNRGVYAEFGVSPSMVIGQMGDADITVSLPGKIGVSLGDYFERPGTGNDDFFGFLQVGGVISAPLEFMPARLGPWQGHAGLHLIALGNNNEAVNGGDKVEIFFEFGMSTTF